MEKDRKDIYTIETILKHRFNSKGYYYLIKWLGFESYDNTWEPESNIYDKKIIEEYWKAHPEITENINPKALKVPREKNAMSLILNTVIYPPKEYCNWEGLIRQICCVERVGSSLMVYIIFKNNYNGMYKLDEAKEKCPQMMAKYFQGQIMPSNPQLE